jgi:hypothetical protein
MDSCVRLFTALPYHRLNLRNREDEVVTHAALPNHQLRTTEPHLCDPSVQQYSGYLDVTDGKHLFFWSVII